MRESEKTKYFIGLDWGLKKSGLAIADDELKIATTLLEVDTKILLSVIKKIQNEYLVDRIILGVLGYDKLFGRNSGNVLRSIKEKVIVDLQEQGLKVELAEEMLTTKIAQQNLLIGGRKRVSKQDNSESARIILQSWLDENIK